MYSKSTRKPNTSETNGCNEYLAAALAALGYGGFAYLKPGGSAPEIFDPTEVLLKALATADLESRVAEALPWLVLAYSDLNWEPTVSRAVHLNLQNRLGYVFSLAHKLAGTAGELKKSKILRHYLKRLKPLRMVARTEEDTFMNNSMTAAEKRWLKENRPGEAKFWHVLTDLKAEHITHV